MNELKEPFVFLGLSEKLECNAPRADGSNYRRHFNRGLIGGDPDFQIKNVVDMHLSMALNNTAAQRQIHDSAFAPHFPARK